MYKFNKKNRVTQINVPKAVPVAVRILTTKNSFSLLTGKGNLSRSVVLDVVMALEFINPIQIILVSSTHCLDLKMKDYWYILFLSFK